LKFPSCVTHNNTILFPPFQHHDLHLASSAFLQTVNYKHVPIQPVTGWPFCYIKIYHSHCQNYDKLFLQYYCFTCFIQHFTVHLFMGTPKYTINSTDSLHYLVSGRVWQFWTYFHFIPDQKWKKIYSYGFQK